jgi:glycosyltransferase involved in cell wall biosynthesis
MRVALVTENFLPKLDGVTRTLAMLLEYLQRHGHKAIVLGPEGAPRHYAGARVFTARGWPLPMYPELRMLVPPPVFARRLARFRPDIVHVVDPMMLGAAGILWARHLGIPVLASYHTNLAAYCVSFHLRALARPMWAYRRFLHNQCAATLCPSPSTALELTRQGFEQVGIWPRGVDAGLFNPMRRSDAWRAGVAGDARRTILLYVGRLSHEKNLGALIAAYRTLQASDTHLVLVGDGPARGEIERALAGQRATFTGYLRGDALAEAYASADVFVFPSTTETFGQVVLEAMASSLPVVACNAEGVRDLVRHGATGLLVDPAAPAAFVGALRTLLADPEERAFLGAHARLVAEPRTWSSVMEGLLSTYQRVIGDPGTLRVA